MVLNHCGSVPLRNFQFLVKFQQTESFGEIWCCKCKTESDYPAWGIREQTQTTLKYKKIDLLLHFGHVQTNLNRKNKK